MLVDPKFPHNVGGALRACACLGAKTLLWTGDRVVAPEGPASRRGWRLPREERLRAFQEVVWHRIVGTFDDLPGLFPKGTIPVAVELLPGAESLVLFEHPADAVYVFGPEDGTLPPAARAACHRFVQIPAATCLNLAAAVNVVLYDRRAKRQLTGLEPAYPLEDFYSRQRVNPTAGYDDGWDRP